MLKTVSSISNAIGALNYKGTWNATTNSPALASGVGTKGDYYVVSTAGSTALDGISNWGVGDWAAFNGSVWQRVEGGADLNGVNLSVSGTSTLSGLTASTALVLNSSKEVVSLVQPAFSAYRAGPNQALTTATFTKVQLNAEEFDTNNNFDSSTNYRFTPKVAGYYQISGSIGLTGTNVRVIASIYKNGSAYFRGIDATANLSQFTVSGLVYLNGSTDYVELYAYGSFAGTSDISSGQIYTYFTGALVRGA